MLIREAMLPIIPPKKMALIIFDCMLLSILKRPYIFATTGASELSFFEYTCVLPRSY